MEEDKGQIDSERLLGLVEARPEIYNNTHKEHHNAEAIRKVWKEIGEELNCPASVCKVKWYSLRSSYSRYLRDMKTPKAPIRVGVKKKKWYLADKLSFLHKHVGAPPRAGRNQDLQEPGAGLVEEEESREEELVEYVNESQDEVSNSEIIFGDGIAETVIEDSSYPRKRAKTSAVEIVAQPMADFFQAAAQHKRPEEEGDPSMTYFFKSLLPDLRELDDRRRRKFKSSVLQIVNELMDQQELAAPSSSSYLTPTSLYSADASSNVQEFEPIARPRSSSSHSSD